MQKQPDYAELRALAASAEGQKLIQMLQKADKTKLSAILTAASGGDYNKAKQELSSLLSGPESEALIRKLEEKL